MISCEPGGVDTKGNKITGFDFDKKHVRENFDAI